MLTFRKFCFFENLPQAKINDFYSIKIWARKKLAKLRKVSVTKTVLTCP